MKSNRRRFLSAAGAAGLSLGAANWFLPAATAQDEVAGGEPLLNDATREAIRKAHEYLASQQRHEGDADDGTFGDGTFSRNAAVVSLCALAFMAGGSTAQRGPYAEQVSRTLGFVLSKVRESGFITVGRADGHGPMYGHGFATLFLAEVYGTTRRADLREKLSKAVRLIVTTQNKEGGWRYDPVPKSADLSVTVCQIMALRAARNAGLHVPKETVEACTEYVKNCQNADGGFRYQLPGGSSEFPRSAAGLVALYSASIYDGPEVEKALKYLMRHLPKPDQRLLNRHYFYAHYYACQAMWVKPDYFRRWYPRIRDELLASQRNDGSWTDDVSREYGTAMAAIILQVPRNMLPIFQR